MPGDLQRTGIRRGVRRLHGDGPPRADKCEQARSAINDVQRALLDVERGFSDCFA